VAATLTAGAELTYASFPIEKVEQTADGHVMVWGKATDDSVDSDQQIIDADFAAKAMDEFFGSGPNIRVQHQAQRDPAGVGVSFERDGDAHWLKSKIIEPVAKQLVLGGALRAYSVGIARPTIQRDSVARGGRITDGQFVEISLVDRPANKNCGIALVKAASDGHAEWVGKVFGSDDMIAKALGMQPRTEDVTLTLPSDVQMSFSPLDMAKIVARKNGTDMITKDVSFVHGGAVPAASAPKEDDDTEVEKDVTSVHGGAVPPGSVPKTDDDAEVEKGKLSTDARNSLPDSAFVFPETREYPIHDKNHARNALSRVSANGTPEEKAKVRAAVARRYPGIGKKMEKKAAKKAAAVAQQALPDVTKPTQKKEKAACAGCGAMQNTAHGFCSECGSKMDAAIPVVKNHDFMCLGCGHELDKGEKFCPGCGKENPGHNPMADLKIPANKSDNGSCVADEPQTATVVKAKKPNKKGKKGNPFGGNQAPPFGKDKDEKDGAEKTIDAPVTGAKVKKGKGFGHTASPGAGAVGQDGIATVPAHREPDGLAVEEFERDAGLPSNHDATKAEGKSSDAICVDTSMPKKKGKRKRAKDIPTGTTPPAAAGQGGDSKPVPGHRSAAEDQVFDRDMAAKFDADPAGMTQIRLKGVGADTATGFMHDLVCPAFSWDQVAKAYPAGLGNLDADEWQQKALTAAASAPLEQAKAASQLGQAAFTIKSAALNDVMDVKNDMFKAFRDANPGPGSFPTPGHIHASQFTRPAITSGLAAYSHQYEGPNSASVPAGSIAASGFQRGFLHDGAAADSPANKSGAPYPQETGRLVNLDYSSVHKANLAQAFTAMHDHFDRVFPGVCPMNQAASGPAAHPLAAVKAESGEVTKKVSGDGMSKKQRRRMEKKLTKKVMSGKMPLDQARIRMGKKPKKSPEPLNPAKAASAEVVKAVTPDISKAFAVELRKSVQKYNKKNSRKFAALTKAVNALADQPDPGTQPFKGMALSHPLRKSAAPAGVPEIADYAARTQAMLLSEMEHQARSTDPAIREAAWQQVLKMKGIMPTS
jgi:hypothetical protein